MRPRVLLTGIPKVEKKAGLFLTDAKLDDRRQQTISRAVATWVFSRTLFAQRVSVIRLESNTDLQCAPGSRRGQG
jgi:hypothetical protein